MDSHEIKPEKMTISLQTKEYYVDISIVCVCVCIYAWDTEYTSAMFFYDCLFVSDVIKLLFIHR